ncbi:MAG: hypothetical protein ACE5JX_17975 [Acidobacteriota bacterium]
MSAKGKRVWTITASAAAIVAVEIYICVMLALALAVIAPVINPWPLVVALAVGIPLSGGGLWWATRRPRHVAAGTVNALLLALQGGIVALLLWPSFVAVDETVILPDGYMGRVQIVHGVAGAVSLERSESGAIIYRIPASGLLLTQDDDPRQEWYRRRYFYQKKDGSLVPITTSWPATIHDTDPDFLDPTVGIYLETGGGSISLENGRCTFSIQGFMVGSKRYIRSIEGVGDTWEKLSAAGLACDRAKSAVHRTR